MASMNWLGFSLSSQELASQPANQDHSGLGFSSDEISGTDVSGACCYLTSDDSAAHSLNLPPFGIFEAFNRNNSQEWEDLGSSKTDKYKMSMVMGSSSGSREQEPKLENLLGRGDREDSGDYIFPNSCFQVGAAAGGSGTSGSSNSIGLSMIKTWLRNQPTQSHNNESAGCGTHALSLSMSTGSHSSSPVLPLLTPNVGAAASSSDNNHPQASSQPPIDTNLPRKSIDTFGQRTSIYRGVTRHRWTGRYEAHLWDNSCRREGQTRKGRQVYLGGYDKEEKAARAYDLAALKYWGTTTTTNFPINNYEKELEEMKHMTRQEYVASLRRKSSGFSRGASIYRGVTRHHQHGRWQARIGRVAGNKDLYLGTFSTQEEAAEAYDIAAIKFRGLNAVTNFDMSRYDVKSILESSTLPIGGAAKRLKDVEHAQVHTTSTTPTLGLRDSHSQTVQFPDAVWPATLAFHPPYAFHYPYGQGQRLWCKQEQDSDHHHHSFHQDINTHNFLQSNSGFLTMDSSSHSASMGMDINNSLIYADHRAAADANSNTNASYGGYLIPLPTDANQNQRSIAINNGLGDNASAYESVFASTDPYHHHARNLYNYISHQSSADDAVKASAYDQASTCNTWVPTAIPTLAPRSTNNIPAAPPFTLLHE